MEYLTIPHAAWTESKREGLEEVKMWKVKDCPKKRINERGCEWGNRDDRIGKFQGADKEGTRAPGETDMPREPSSWRTTAHVGVETDLGY
jgi:hypothetical protein